jgi:predicted phage baseplate assembly protein
MPILPPALDDRSFNDLVQDLVRRIPAHTPEWTNPQDGDPGRTLIDLFAWLADTILYRANLVPERQRLTFLRLLGAPMRPPQPASGLIALTIDDKNATDAVQIDRFARIDQPVPFETTQAVTVLPVGGQCYIKRRLETAESAQLIDLLPDLQRLYALSGNPTGYVTTPLFVDGTAVVVGRDVVAESVDGYLWIALLAADPTRRDAVHAALGAGPDNRRRVLSVGVAPALPQPSWDEDVGIRARIPYVWEISQPTAGDDEPSYLGLDVLVDGTVGLTRAGVIQMLLPGADDFGAPSNDVLNALHAGVGDRPPRLDDPALAARLVTWLRLRPDPAALLQHLRLAWAGINAVTIEQRQTLGRRTIGQGNGASDLMLSLGATSVEAATLQIQVEEEEGLRMWRQVPDTAIAGRDEPVFSLDPEAGTVRFGDGVRGRVPQAGRLVQVASMRAGGGTAGNVPPGSVTQLASVGPGAAPPPSAKLNIVQPLSMAGGIDAETLPEAERRIPAFLRNRDRAVVASDYKAIAARVPGLAVGRVEVLPKFRPAQRLNDQAGVISVMLFPQRADIEAPAPRADRPFLETAYRWLDERRPLATELYVIGCEYVPLAVSVAVELRDPDQRDSVLTAVGQSVKAFLWALSGGPDGTGWPLGRPVYDREIEVAVARVPGVDTVAPPKLFTRAASATKWQLLPADAQGRVQLPLQPWQLPELLAVAVTEGTASPNQIVSPTNGGQLVAVPVVPETC